MIDFLRLYREPTAEEQTAQEMADLETALLEDGGSNAPAKKEEVLDKGTGSGSSGKQEGSQKSDSLEDPEYEIENGKDDKGSPIKIKAKLSELKAGYLRNDDYTKKSQRIAEVEKNQKDMIATIEAIRQQPKLAKLFVGIVEGAITKDGYNLDFIDKQLSTLQGVQAEKKDTKEDLSDKQEDIEKLLEEVDADSPIAKALKQTYRTNQALMKRLEGLEGGLGKTTKTVEEQISKEQEKQYQTLVDSAAKIMNDTLEGLANPDKGTLDFASTEERQEWRYRVVSYLKDHPHDYKDDKEFVARLNEVSQSVHKYMKNYRESLIASKLDANKLKKKEEPVKQTQSQEATTLEEDLIKELEALDGKTA